MHPVICPLFGGQCPGPSSCAPARYSAYVDDEGTEHYRCPVQVATDAMQALAFSMEPFIHNLVGVQGQKQASPEDMGREKFIADVLRPDHREG